MLEDNLLTDESLNYLSQLISEGMCPELSEIYLACMLSMPVFDSISR